MTLSIDNLKEIMKKLADNRHVFHSEADFQHSLALEIKDYKRELELRLEKFVGIEKNEKKKDKSVYMDLVIIDKNKKIVSAIELKYKTFTKSKNGTKQTIQDEDYFLKRQGAEDLGRYDFLKDIKRLESFNKEHNCQKSFAIMLTNDKHYWDSKYGKDGFSEEFCIGDKTEPSPSPFSLIVLAMKKAPLGLTIISGSSF
jgi:hypothetical protein